MYMISNRSMSARARIVPMGILKSRPTGAYRSPWEEILSCLLSIHIHRVAVTTHSMSEDLIQFLASMLQTLGIGTIRKKKKKIVPLSTLCAICWHSIVTRLVVPTS